MFRAIGVERKKATTTATLLQNSSYHFCVDSPPYSVLYDSSVFIQ